MRARLVAFVAALALSGSWGATAAAAAPASDARSGTVEVKRDRFGVPHVYADTVYGLFYGYGYAVAQDRLFQLEMVRRATSGTASEVLGPDLVAVDEMARFETDRESLARQLEALPEKHRDALEGYAAGFSRRVAEVNADPAKLLPKEFSELGFRPKPWSALDVAMAVSGGLINRFCGPNQELENLELYHDLRRLHGPDKAWQILQAVHWINDPTAYTTVPADLWHYAHAIDDTETLHPLQQKLVEGAARPIPTLGFLDLYKGRKDGQNLHEHARELLAMNGISGRGGFESESNVWLINGRRLQDAKAVLVNGPQVGWTSPSYIYNVGLHGAGFEVFGSAYLGLPFLMTGHNGSVGWGVTATLADLVDMYEETLNPLDPELYLHKGEWKRFATRREVVRVKGQADRQVIRRESVHGPIVAYDPDKRVAYAKKRTWDGSELESIGAWMDMTIAEDTERFRIAAKRLAVSANVFYLDAAGNIGYQMAGFYPLRAPGHDLRLPAAGTGEMDWIGLARTDDSPAIQNPSAGFLVNWNNKPGTGWPNGDQWWTLWGGAHHVRLLADRLNENPVWTRQEAWELIRYSSYADHNLSYFLPYLRQAMAESRNASAKAALSILDAWDGQWRDDNGDGKFDGPAPALMEAFMTRLFREVIADDVGERSFARFAATAYPTREILVGADMPPGTRVVIHNLDALEGKIPLAYDLFNEEPPLAVLRRVFEATVAELERERGVDIANWQVAAFKPRYSTTNHMGIRWGSETPRHVTAFQNRGGVNAMYWADGHRLHAATIIPLGQSGMIYPDGQRDPHFEDQREIYDAFGKIAVPFSDSEVDAQLSVQTRLLYIKPERTP